MCLISKPTPRYSHLSPRAMVPLLYVSQGPPAPLTHAVTGHSQALERSHRNLLLHLSTSLSSDCLLQALNSPGGRMRTLPGHLPTSWEPAVAWAAKRRCQLLSRVPLFATPGTVACQAPLSLGLSRQEYWSGLLFTSPSDLPNSGIEPGSPALQAHSAV